VVYSSAAALGAFVLPTSRAVTRFECEMAFSFGAVLGSVMGCVLGVLAWAVLPIFGGRAPAPTPGTPAGGGYNDHDHPTPEPPPTRSVTT